MYAGVMSRTNIDIDDQLLEKVMQVYRLHTKKEAVNFALRQLIGEPLTKEEVLAMRGMGYETDIEELRPGLPWYLREGF